MEDVMQLILGLLHCLSLPSPAFSSQPTLDALGTQETPTSHYCLSREQLLIC